MARVEIPPTMQQLLTDEQIKVMALVPMSKSGASLFFSARWPDYRHLFEGVYFATQGDTVEEAVENYRQLLWRGL